MPALALAAPTPRGDAPSSLPLSNAVQLWADWPADARCARGSVRNQSQPWPWWCKIAGEVHSVQALNLVPCRVCFCCKGQLTWMTSRVRWGLTIFISACKYNQFCELQQMWISLQGDIFFVNFVNKFKWSLPCAYLLCTLIFAWTLFLCYWFPLTALQNLFF